MAASLFDAMVRHQIYVEGLKRGKAGSLGQSLLKLNTDVKAELSRLPYESLGDMTRTQVMLLLGRLKKLADGVFNAWLNELIEWLQRYIQVDCELLRRVWAATTDKTEDEIEDKSRDYVGIWASARNTPIGANGVLLLPFLTAFAVQSTARIVSTVNMAYANRLTIPQTITAISGPPRSNGSPGAPQGSGGTPGGPSSGGGSRGGTPGGGSGAGGAAKPMPIPVPSVGIIETLNRSGAAVTNTVLQHVAAQTNFNSAKNVFEQYLWVSVIDAATTQICRGRNGNVYTYGEGPLPPAHINCRSQIMPFDGTGPSTIPTFKIWVDGQVREFVNDAFDRPPGSEYDGSRPVSLDEFAGKFGNITA